MDFQFNDSPNDAKYLSEIQRLKTMIPAALRSQIKIMEAQSPSSGLIETTRSQQHQFCIQLALHRWQNLDRHQRNLLFWHEVALIQGQLFRVHPFSPEKFVLAIGGVVFLLELMSQNVLGLSTTLSVMGLAAYQLYQRSYGEGYIRSATAADQAAIRMATEFGYSASFATESLSSALQVLARQPHRKPGPNTYPVRLRVLEILQSQVVSPAKTELLHPRLSALYSVQPQCS